MSNFDKKAADWDKNHDHTTRANKLVDYLGAQIDLSKVKNAMEYGSGTGLLSFALKDKLPSIDLMDASIEMTKAAQQKVADQSIASLHPVQYDIMTQELPANRYDLIFILQTLHHIDDTALFIQKSSQLLNNGGYLVIIDLVQEDGSFHEDEFHGHKGFVQSELEHKLRDSGLTPTYYGICHTIEKEMEDGSIKEYPLFMMVGKK
ncbi:MAG: class I SAM-dependent methyltransferase [Cyclobacteriaceae bacterium]|nr:class I SAM-dependent methyltransferase [Cyclobacteriaceae bacterium]